MSNIEIPPYECKKSHPFHSWDEMALVPRYHPSLLKSARSTVNNGHQTVRHYPPTLMVPEFRKLASTTRQLSWFLLEAPRVLKLQPF
ncbi:hypothetical protein [Limosilactobacillus fermentum]|uniref:hypothetical protein n=1 Tax=Limosilactobacillus fermentum TaxID=1613 RepID=UPI001C0B1605|nr:hypothetical protein [Limosilactobacillus fermentum]QWQ33705.1 hypothetical protein KOM17_00360 [Limosilactobacillus fermentum]